MSTTRVFYPFISLSVLGDDTLVCSSCRAEHVANNPDAAGLFSRFDRNATKWAFLGANDEGRFECGICAEIGSKR